MDITVEKSIDTSRNLEKQLQSQLAVNNVSYSQVEESLSKICAACSTALLYDFESAITQGAENRLWDTHLKVNTYYRAALEKLRTAKDPSAVARRKLEGSYLRFIKNAQKFYRGYIRELAAVHGQVPELERAAKKVGNDYQLKSTPRQQTANREHLLLSLHTTLIHLGDLSRYRETELSGKERNWGPAIGFYDLAVTILPSSGLSYNQLAVIALSDGNLFRATYQLYRALSSEEPHPQAENNLRRAFYKISAAWKANELSTTSAMTAGAGLPSGLIALYLRLISIFYHGKSFSERDELETEVVTQLETNLKTKDTDSSPTKLVIINIAAGHAAQERLMRAEGNSEAMQSYLFFLRLNIRTHLTLLRVLATELGKVQSEEVKPESLATLVTPSMQRILPVLRLYSSWLSRNVDVLSNNIDINLQPLQAEFWTCYAQILTMINATFPPQYLPQPLAYMLSEDEDTIGLIALHCDENRTVWFDGAKLRTKWHEVPTQHRNASTEMLARIRDLLAVGVGFAVDERAPVELEGTSAAFVYSPRQEVVASQDATISVPPGFEQTVITNPSSAHHEPPISGPGGDEDLEDDFEANAMVDSLVGADEDTDPTADISQAPLRRSPATPPSHSSNSPFLNRINSVPNLLEVSGTNSLAARSPRPAPGLLPGLGMSPLGSHSPKLAQAPRSPVVGGAAFVGWGTPQQLPPPTSSRPGTSGHSAPMIPPGLGGHSRMNSGDSITSPWMPDNTWSTFAPTDSMRSGRRSLLNNSLGNGTFGEIITRRESQPVRGLSFNGSPLLGGDGWGTPERSGGYGGLTSPMFDRQGSFTGTPTTPTANTIGSIGSGRPRPIK